MRILAIVLAFPLFFPTGGQAADRIVLPIHQPRPKWADCIDRVVDTLAALREKFRIGGRGEESDLVVTYENLLERANAGAGDSYFSRGGSVYFFDRSSNLAQKITPNLPSDSELLEKGARQTF